jgi:hypothetical protein
MNTAARERAWTRSSSTPSTPSSRVLAAVRSPSAKDGVELTDDRRFIATYGFLRVETPLDNIDDAHITTAYRWWTAAGARLSFVDDGLTFGTRFRRC